LHQQTGSSFSPTLTIFSDPKQQQQQPPFYSHYTGQPALAVTSSYELEDLLLQSFTARTAHALADGNKCIRIREEMLFNSVIYTVSILSDAKVMDKQYK